jgi:hypothetical protein
MTTKMMEKLLMKNVLKMSKGRHDKILISCNHKILTLLHFSHKLFALLLFVIPHVFF